MIVPYLLFSLAGLALFYLQNLVFFTQVHLRLLALLLFLVALRAPLSLALSLGLTLGLLQDSYATTPLGLHMAVSLVLVATARFLRRRFLLQRIGPQVLASLGALLLQELLFRLILFISGAREFLIGSLALQRGVEILCTAALAPLMYSLVRGLEKLLNRPGRRSRETFHSPPLS